MVILMGAWSLPMRSKTLIWYREFRFVEMIATSGVVLDSGRVGSGICMIVPVV